MRVLGMSFPIIGHVTPILGPLAELRRRGHEVSWAALPCVAAPDVRRWIESFGVEVCELGFARPEGARPAAQDMVEIYLDVAQYVAFARDLYVAAAGEQVAPLRALLRELRPEVVLCDTLLAQAYIACSLEDVPFIGFPGNLRALRQGGHWSPQDVGSDLLTEDRRRVFRASGLPLPPVRMNHIMSPYQNVIPVTADLLPREVAETVPESMMLVGPTPPELGLAPPRAFPWERLASDRRKVYVSFGTVIGGRPELFAKLAAVCTALGVQAIFTDGGQRSGYQPGPEHLLVDYAPQRELLEVCDLFVTHGGANSVSDGVEAAVAMLVIPFFMDQFDAGHYVERLGIGVQLRREAVTEASLMGTLGRLLGDHGAMRSRMQAMPRPDAQRANRTVADAAERLARR